MAAIERVFDQQAVVGFAEGAEESPLSNPFVSRTLKEAVQHPFAQ